ncbi:MAG: hypothetical protein M1833_006468 [Piccolia ochrophora]|nr:MAG: hypothetical protein M1833_006468 [Piccolia ochrophora]
MPIHNTKPIHDLPYVLQLENLGFMGNSYIRTDEFYLVDRRSLRRFYSDSRGPSEDPDKLTSNALELLLKFNQYHQSSIAEHVRKLRLEAPISTEPTPPTTPEADVKAEKALDETEEFEAGTSLAKLELSDG